MSRTDVRTNGGAEAQTTMATPSRDTSMAPESTRIEPIFDASGTLRRDILRRPGATPADHAASESAGGNPRSTR